MFTVGYDGDRVLSKQMVGNMSGKISMILIVIALVAMAIMFDWFGSRELAQKGVDGAQVAVEKLENTGDKVNRVLESMDEEEK